jgi:hypothetical protein
MTAKTISATANSKRIEEMQQSIVEFLKTYATSEIHFGF